MGTIVCAYSRKAHRVTDPEGTVKLFRALALMFGATGAVYAFVRISRAIAHLGLRLFDLVLMQFLKRRCQRLRGGHIDGIHLSPIQRDLKNMARAVEMN